MCGTLLLVTLGLFVGSDDGSRYEKACRLLLSKGASLGGIPVKEVAFIECDDIVDFSFLSCLRDLPKLHRLEFFVSSISNGDLAHLSALAMLKDLTLCECRMIDDNGMTHLRNLRQLELLDLTGQVGIGNRGLSFLQGLSRLKELRLARTRVSDAGLKHISGMTELEVWLIRLMRILFHGRRGS